MTEQEKRKRDEQDLELLRMVDSGHTMKVAGEAFGLSKGTVIGRIDRIRKAIEKYP